MRQEDMLRQARSEIQRRRQAAETAADKRRQEIYAAVPELGLLDEKKAKAGAQAARLAADGMADRARQKLEEVRAVAKRRAQLLQHLGYTQADLEPRYHCAECGDTGQKGTSVCTCVLEEVKRIRREGVNESGPLSLCRFENFHLEYYPEKLEGLFVSPREMMGRILQDCRDYAADFGPSSPSLLMFGDAGLGKTHLALSIATEVLDKGFDVIYVSAQNAFAALSEQRFDGAGELLRSMLEADLLILDDLGIEYVDAYVLSRMYELVNSRMHRRPTIYTTNICDPADMQMRYTEKISSRLLGGCHQMRFVGEDLRLKR